MKERMALLMDEFANEDPGMLMILHIGSNSDGSGALSPKVEKQIKYTMMRVNNEAIYMMPFMSEFEILNMIRNVESMNEPDIEIILKMFDKDKSMIVILFFYFSSTTIYILFKIIIYIKINATKLKYIILTRGHYGLNFE